MNLNILDHDHWVQRIIIASKFIFQIKNIKQNYYKIYKRLSSQILCVRSVGNSLLAFEIIFDFKSNDPRYFV